MAFSYLPQNDDELELKVGDIIEVVGEVSVPGGWVGDLARALRTRPWLALLWQMLEPKETLAAIWLSLFSEELGSQTGMPPSPLGAGVGHLKLQPFSHSGQGLLRSRATGTALLSFNCQWTRALQSDPEPSLEGEFSIHRGGHCRFKRKEKKGHL